MPKLVGVANTPPIYAMGLAGALPDDRFLVKAAEDPAAWINEHHDAALLLGVHEPSDLDIVIGLKPDAPDSVVVTIVDDPNPDLLLACLKAGATGAIPVGATVEEVTVALEAAFLNKTVLPAALAKKIGNGSPPESGSTLNETELALMQGLACGMTVAELGAEMGYSEREIYRQLQRIYRKLGVAKRIDAIVKMAAWGLLD